jgi:hypothetical protein
MSPPQGLLRIFGASARSVSTFPNRYRTVLDVPMTDELSPATSTVPKPWIWLLIAGVLSVVSIVWLWSMTGPRVCILVYPAPPGCTTVIPDWLPFISIAIIVVLFAAMVVLYLVRKPGARPLVALTILIAAVTLLTALIMLLAGLGVFDPYQPPVILD